MLDTLLARVLSAPDSPTADLYFRNACADLLGRGVVQVAPTVFASKEACLVMRHGLRAGQLPVRRRLIYMVDDAVDDGIRDATLPFFYRQKLRMVEHAASRRLRPLADIAVVSSPALAERFRGIVETRLIRPYWSEGLATLDHFGRPDGAEGRIELAYLGSITHCSDMAFLVPVIRRLLATHRRLRIHLAARHRLPPDLDRHPRLVRIAGGGWTAYRRELAGRRFHIALYPLLDSPFNRGRSANKLIEHAVVGAAPVYSSGWEPGRMAAQAGGAIVLPNDPHAWYAGIDGLIRDPARCRRLAARSRALAGRLNDPAAQRRLWSELLGVGEPVLA